MRNSVVALAMVALALTVIGVAPSRGGKTTEDARYLQAHRAAVKYRKQRDHVQQLLTVRVKQVHRLERAMRRKPHGSHYAIRLASDLYNVPEQDLRSVAGCETGGSFDPGSFNRRSQASGLFQFLPSTWNNQGLPRFDVFDPVANALAAARIVAREGFRQWTCRP